MSLSIIIDDVKNFLSNNDFIPHENGNNMCYGLNSFGCDSIIKYNNDIWKFLWFLTGTNKAVYMNKEGLTCVFDPYNNNSPIIRMQIVQ
jgi:hypothetical protein